MTRPRRVLWAIVICVGIGIGGATSSTLAQTFKEPLGSDIKPPVYPHHVVGSLSKLTSCGTNLTVVLRESWYVANNIDLSGATFNLVPAGNTLVGLTTRTLGSAPVDPSTGKFDVQWSEPYLLGRVPWGTARHVQTGAQVTAYRVLTLQIIGGAGGGVATGTPQPLPIITFFGNEASKNVGGLTGYCIPQS